VCGEKRTTVTTATTPNHIYNPNWIHGHDDVSHWEYCTECGNKKSEKHHMVYDAASFTDYCDKCMYIPSEYYLTLDNVEICPHRSAKVSFTHLPEARQDRIKNWNNVSYKWKVGNTVVWDTSSSFTPTLEQCNSWSWNQTITFTVTFDTQDMGEYSVNAYVQPLTKIAEVPATCGDSGVKAHYLCTCGKIVDEKGNVISASSLEIPATGKHTYDNDCDETCNYCGAVREVSHSYSTEWGHDGDFHFHTCSLCGKPLDIGAHDMTTTLMTPGSCYNDAVYQKTCHICGMNETVTVPASTHEIVHVEEVPATCVERGYMEHYACVLCGATFSDAAGTTKAPLETLRTEINSKNHAGGKYKYNDSQHWILCECGEKLNTEDHTLDGEKHCGVCGYKYHYNPKRVTETPNPYAKDKKTDKADSEDNETTEPEKAQNKTGMWIAIGAAAVLLIALIVLLTVLLNKRKKAGAETTEEADGAVNEASEEDGE